MATLTPVRPAPAAPTNPAGPGEVLADRVRPGTRWLLSAFVGLTSLAVLALLISPETAHQDFAWSIHMPLTAAFLGASYAAGCLLSVLSLRQRTWSEIRVPVITVAAFTALTLVATLIHAHRLHLVDGGMPGRSAAWLWLAVYLVVPFACIAVIARQECDRPRQAVHLPLPRWLAWLLGVQGAVLTAAGAILFLGGLTVHHVSEPMTGFWPWNMMPLSSMVTGAWLIAFGVAAALSIRERDLSRLRVPAVAYTAFGLVQLAVLIGYRDEVDGGDPWLWGYVALLVTAVLTGGYGWRAARRARPAQA
jgi:uncharacterized integral membrane protein